ncbi:MAG TPA: tetratricopeptide repeat protein [Pyrinomonadaceae bacterium]|jgi:tetratricopeptide (TPR) repeat protein|nr:tetratricopeptide repeat protein [Pyrinomonadaceae bacterium]
MRNKLTAREHWDKAFDYWWEGNVQGAIEEGRLAMDLNPSLARPHWIVGQAYLRAEPPDREAALKEFRELVRKDPRWVEGHASLAATLLQQGRTAEALKSIREVLRLNPNCPWAQLELSKHLLEHGEYRQAVAVLLGKASPPTFCTVADAHLLRAELWWNRSHEEARAEWEYILTLDETIPANRVAQVEARKRLMETKEPERVRAE